MSKWLALACLLALLMPSAVTAQSTKVLASFVQPSDDILLLAVIDGRTSISVSILSENVPSVHDPPIFKNPLYKRSVQVWLLRSDGTILRQTRKPSAAATCMAAHCNDGVQADFEHAPASELTGVVAQQPTLPPSNRGLAITATSVVPVLEPSQDIELEVTFQNVSSELFRLPDSLDRLVPEFWRLEARNLATDAVWTGVSSARSCARVLNTPDAVIPAGGSRSARVRLGLFGFVPGALDREAAYRALRAIMEIGCGASKGPTLPRLVPGDYTLTLDVEFIESYQGDRNPVPVWFGGPLGIVTSRPFIISVRQR